MNFRKLLSVVIWVPLYLNGQQTLSQKAGTEAFPLVGAEVKVIELKTLTPDPSLQKGARPVTLKPLTHPLSEDFSESNNAVNYYHFVLQPGEKIITRLKGDGIGNITQRFGTMSGLNIVPSALAKAAITRMNSMPRPRRSKELEFRNQDSTPFHLMLVVYGKAGYPITIEIERGAAEK